MTRRKNPVRCDYHLGQDDLQSVNEKTDDRCHYNKLINVGNSSSHGLC